VVIDNSSAFRMHDDVPLVVPEVNPEDAKKHKGIIANPNCSTIQMVVVLQPLHKEAAMERVVVSTYQAVSGAGKEAMDELKTQSRSSLDGTEIKAEYFPHKGAARNYQMAFNLVPQIDVFSEEDYTKEELKMIKETRKIMGLPDLRITATTVRVPVYNAHSESVNIEFARDITPERAREILREAPGVIVQDDPASLIYPMPADASGRDEVFVGRIRKDLSIKYGLNLWVVSDNLRKGAATNSIQIAELLV
jgi:aspartate-semialdehyde dehydrogenase